MVVSFLGHSTLCDAEKLLPELIRAIRENTVGAASVTFYCGGYGAFDELCARACRIVREGRARCEVVLVTPYLLMPGAPGERNTCPIMAAYDVVLYPPLEHVPPRFAIERRNEWMVREADLIIAYVKRTYGGAYKSLCYARRRRKTIINLAEG